MGGPGPRSCPPAHQMAAIFLIGIPAHTASPYHRSAGGAFLWTRGCSGGTMRWQSVKTVLRDKPEIGIAASSAAAGLVITMLDIFGVNFFGINDIKVVLAVTLLTLGSLSWNIFRSQLADQSRDKSISQVAELIRDTSMVV